ncbi:hypothetical protein [Flavobacterium sp. ACN6]|uniref:hypothetical protein n=1 Tax=Flavobacterium sp. ACN6 TaxID=1920426 RepID=UPI000BB37813|nr:hypothetical protein [Flavobacterium sp. ACN6]PBJ13708.1 hypothetical protein BSF42_11840 [Flavobacterium sp. ACN6]
MKKILMFLTVITLCACDSKDEKDVLGLTYDISAELSIFNDQNEDLLNPNNPNHLDISKIRLFYVINGVNQEFHNLNVESTSVLRIVKRENEYRIKMLLNDYDKSEKTTIYLQWDESQKDTIQSTFEKSYNLYRPKKIWYNNKLVWQLDYGVEECYFKIVK